MGPPCHARRRMDSDTLPDASASQRRCLTAKEMADVNCVDAIRSISDITGIDWIHTTQANDVDQERIFRKYFPEDSFRARLTLALKTLVRLFPFPRFVATDSIVFLPASLSLSDIGQILEEALTRVRSQEQTLLIIDDQDLDAGLDAVESLAITLELQSALLRMILEIQALQLRVKKQLRDTVVEVSTSDVPSEDPVNDSYLEEAFSLALQRTG